jgi:hypothetical protein
LLDLDLIEHTPRLQGSEVPQGSDIDSSGCVHELSPVHLRQDA